MGKALAHRHADATAVQIEKERNKPLRAPLIVVVAAKVDEQCKIPAIEQVLSAAAAAENVMVDAFAHGFGCEWKTGEAAYDPEIKSAFGLAPNDAIVGFLYLGSNANAPSAPPVLDLSEYVIEWDNRASS